LLGCAAGVAKAASIPERVRMAVAEGRAIWVSLNDKGPDTVSLSNQPWISSRAQERIALRGGTYPLGMDWPVYKPYKEALRAAGMEIRSESRWLNAVAGTIAPERLPELAGIACVSSLRPVPQYRRRTPEPSDEPPPLRKPSRQSHAARYDYGPSAAQLELIQADWLHAYGLDGDGVFIGFLDTGYDLSAPVFDSLRLVATHDFINNDDNVQEGNTNQRMHGTGTVSVCGGFYPGQLIGAAPKAEYALAETETVDSETRIEEDRWVAGLEWLDSLGCDLVSSSLGYLDWYTYDSLDGNSAWATRHADLAAARGMLVVNAAGNEGDKNWKYVIVPADGDSVLAVGATTLAGVRAGFSSVGPTFDGRTKPDVMAPGVNVRCAIPGPFGFAGLNGTSFATPLVSGVCALLLQNDPSLTPYDLITRLRETATRASAPNDSMGWGIVQGARAANLPEALLVAFDDAYTTPMNTPLEVEAPGVLTNDFDSFGDFDAVFLGSDVAHGELDLHSDGSFAYTPGPGFIGDDVFTYWASDGALASDTATVTITVTAVGTTGRVELWPNPMNDTVRIVLPETDPGGSSRVHIYTTAGGPVYSQEFTGSSMLWRGVNDDGEAVASGIYLVLVQTQMREELVKLAVIRR
jgi:serine protease AprX